MGENYCEHGYVRRKGRCPECGKDRPGTGRRRRRSVYMDREYTPIGPRSDQWRERQYGQLGIPYMSGWVPLSEWLRRR